jgi:hypothetical protein
MSQRNSLSSPKDSLSRTSITSDTEKGITNFPMLARLLGKKITPESQNFPSQNSIHEIPKSNQTPQGEKLITTTPSTPTVDSQRKISTVSTPNPATSPQKAPKITPKKTELPINYRNFFDDLKKKKTPTLPPSPGTPENLFLKKSEIFEDDNLSLPTIRRKF